MPGGSIYVLIYTQQLQHIEKRQRLVYKQEHTQNKTVTQSFRQKQFPYILVTSLPFPSLVITFLTLFEKILILTEENPITPSGS
jgi:hypothetical protein